MISPDVVAREKPRIGRRCAVVAGMAALVTVSVGGAARAQDEPEPWIASPRYARQTNPLPPEKLYLNMGKKLFERECASCHGETGRGDGPKAAKFSVRASDLTIPAIWAQSDGELFRKITKGRKPMPAFKRLLSEDERWRVLAYQRTLAPRPKVFQPRFATDDSFRRAISGVVDPYLRAQTALVGDDASTAVDALGELSSAVGELSKIDASSLHEDIAKAWTSAVSQLSARCAATELGGDLEAVRGGFAGVSMAIEEVVRLFGHAEKTPLRLFVHAGSGERDGERIWLQREADPNSPYGSTAAGDAGVLRRTLGSGRTMESTKGDP